MPTITDSGSSSGPAEAYASRRVMAVSLPCAQVVLRAVYARESEDAGR
jgi:hypothetical protein